MLFYHAKSIVSFIFARDFGPQNTQHLLREMRLNMPSFFFFICFTYFCMLRSVLFTTGAPGIWLNILSLHWPIGENEVDRNSITCILIVCFLLCPRPYALYMCVDVCVGIETFPWCVRLQWRNITGMSPSST